jgi:hypothetical protein
MPRRRSLSRPSIPRPNRVRHARRVANLRLQGIATALGELASTHSEPDLAAMVLDTLGLSIADLRRAGADAYDLEHLFLATDEAPDNEPPGRLAI